MAVAVVPQLDRLLRNQDLSLASLRLMVEERCGFVVNLADLEALSRPESVGWTDLRLAAAVATVLGSSLDDLYLIEETPGDSGLSLQDELAANEASSRLLELGALQDAGQLDADGVREIDVQLDRYGQAIRALHLRSAAAKRGISFEEMVAEADRDLAERLALIRRREDDPIAQQEFAARIEQYRASMQR